MPEQDYIWLPREHLLRFEEISALVDIFLELGVTRVRLTGGEPLLRRDLPSLVRLLAAKRGLADLALTTNGVLLSEQSAALKSAGLGRVTVSLDTLRRDRFEALTRFDGLDQVKAGIRTASDTFGTLKIDAVVIRGVNDDELVDLVEYGRRVNGEVRFIEYMDVGGATRWSRARVCPKDDILARLTARYGPLTPYEQPSSAPAERYALKDGTIVGIIASTTSPFCGSCDRSRLTADGLWYLCLYARAGTDLGALLRRGAAAEEIRSVIEDSWRHREDRGAEDRLALGQARDTMPLAFLRDDPHLEMHTRGG
jgi:cyclic pyranopterin phosphate synthase